MAGSDLSSISVDAQLDREWLATNGIGGFAASTLPGLNTRKYHGLLVAAMSPPVRQMVLLSRVEEFVLQDGQAIALASCEYPGVIHPRGYQFLRAFSPDPFPRWAFQGEGWTIEKQLRLIPGENTVCLSYTLLGGERAIELELNPLFALRGIHDLMYQWNGRLIAETIGKAQPHTHHRIPATNRTPEVFFAHDGRFQGAAYWYLNTIYRCENQRGYPGLEDVWMPGTVRWTLHPGKTIHFACSTDPIDLGRIISHIEREDGLSGAPIVAEPKADTALDALVRAARQFVVHGGCGAGFQPASQEQAESPHHKASARIVAGYPWLPPAGRDALIGFPGLLLLTGRLEEAKSLLQLCASLEDRGLMPSDLPWDGSTPKYQGADVSLWFINAVWQYLRYGGDREFVLHDLLPKIESILRQYREGTDLGIRVDAEGLLVSQQPGTAATWMDAQVGDWVMTPRYGRPVEVNALWYNAQRIAAVLAHAAGQEQSCGQWLGDAEMTKVSFNRRFWNEGVECCLDVVGDTSVDAAVRPNQIFAISLPFSVLSVDRHQAVLEVVRRELLTPVGLRTLSPRDPNYHGSYGGPVVSRDRAYHQGTVFPWLLGPYITALVKMRGRSQVVRGEAYELLRNCFDYLKGNGLGQLCELFDGDPPHHPGGLRASARSVAEVLRCYVEDVLDLAPAGANEPISSEGMTIAHPSGAGHTAKK